MKNILNIILVAIDAVLLLVIITGIGAPKAASTSADNSQMVASQSQVQSETPAEPQAQSVKEEEPKAQTETATEAVSQTSSSDLAKSQSTEESQAQEEEGYKGFANESEYQRYLFSGGYEDEDSSGDVSGFANSDGVRTDEHGYYLPSDVAAAISTQEKSTRDDFDWFVDDVWNNGMPEGSEFIKNPEDVVGYWKCMIIYDPADKEGKQEFHYGTMYIGADKNDGETVTMSPHIEWGYTLDKTGKEVDESDRNWFLGIGEWTEGWIGNTQANHNIKIRLYETGDGKQYGYGGITLQDADVKSVGVSLVRP